MVKCTQKTQCKKFWKIMKNAINADANNEITITEGGLPKKGGLAWIVYRFTGLNSYK